MAHYKDCTVGDDGTPHNCMTGEAYYHPKYCTAAGTCGNGLPGFDSYDVGVVVLDEEVSMNEYAVLPEAGLVDGLPMRTPVMIVGYGVQWKAQIPGSPYYRWTGYRMRFSAPSLLIQSNDVISDEFIKLTANPGQGKGGTCFGDSGGPDLWTDGDGHSVVLAVNSFVTSYNCAGVTYSNRVDLADILEWIDDFY